MADRKSKRKEEIQDIQNTELIRSDALSEYATHVGSALIRPEDKGKIKGVALKAMYEQTDIQFHQIKEQIDLLAYQAKLLQKRISISEDIYQADFGFEPVILKSYYLYQREDNSHILSMIGPQEWGSSFQHQFIAQVRLLADHTWEVMEEPR